MLAEKGVKGEARSRDRTGSPWPDRGDRCEPALELAPRAAAGVVAVDRGGASGSGEGGVEGCGGEAFDRRAPRGSRLLVVGGVSHRLLAGTCLVAQARRVEWRTTRSFGKPRKLAYSCGKE